MKKLTLVFTLLTLLTVGIILGGLLFWKLQTLGMQSNSSAANKHYFSDEFYLYGNDSEGKPFLAEFLFQRKQLDTGEFTHFYTVEMLSQDKYTEAKIQKKYPLSEIDQKGFLNEFNQTQEANLSAQSSYEYSFTIEGTVYKVKTDTFNNDFIVRNKPNYTKYIDMGKGTVTSEGKAMNVSIVHMGSYAENYSEYVFFDGFYQLDSVAHLVILWDKIGNTYLVDQSQVTSDQKNYHSHTWVLKKDSFGRTKKAFSATIGYRKEDFPSTWSLSIPSIDDTEFSFSVIYNNDRATGFADGRVRDSEGMRVVNGYVLITHY